MVGGWIFSRFIFHKDWDHDYVFPGRREDARSVNFIKNIKESVLTPRFEVFKAVNGESVVSGGFPLHFVDSGLKFHYGKWFICFVKFLDGGGGSVHSVFSPCFVYRDIGL